MSIVNFIHTNITFNFWFHLTFNLATSCILILRIFNTWIFNFWRESMSLIFARKNIICICQTYLSIFLLLFDSTSYCCTWSAFRWTRLCAEIRLRLRNNWELAMRLGSVIFLFVMMARMMEMWLHDIWTLLIIKKMLIWKAIFRNLCNLSVD